jgi:hypothetical protein
MTKSKSDKNLGVKYDLSLNRNFFSSSLLIYCNLGAGFGEFFLACILEFSVKAEQKLLPKGRIYNPAWRAQPLKPIKRLAAH